MTEHTPGPWTSRSYHTGGLHDGPSGFHILPDDNVRRGEGQATLHALADVFSEANARLIAAAPEMLEALKAVRAYHNGGKQYDMAQIDAAIAKARGEEK